MLWCSVLAVLLEEGNPLAYMVGKRLFNDVRGSIYQ